MDDLRVADAAQLSHKGIRNGHRVNSGQLIGLQQKDSLPDIWQIHRLVRRRRSDLKSQHSEFVARFSGEYLAQIHRERELA